MPDLITHASIGFIVARHFFKGHKPLFILSSMAPDIDILVGITYLTTTQPFDIKHEEAEAILTAFHPSFSASFFFLPLFVLLLILTFRLIKKNMVPSKFKQSYILVTAAILVHLGLDLLMTGNRPFWPLSFEAGLGVIPYTSFGATVTVIVALLLLFLDLLFYRQQT